MKYYNRALRDLRLSKEKNFEAIYNVVFSFPDNVFYEYLDGFNIVQTTYEECRLKTVAAAAFLSDRLSAYEKGSNIGLWLDNCPEWIISFWALLMAGYTPVLLNRRNDVQTVKSLIKAADIRILVSDEPFEDMEYVDTQDYPSDEACKNAGFVPTWNDRIMLCTSGTSGLPKLCLYDGHAIADQVFNTKYVLKENSSIKTYYKGYAKLLCFLPFCHIFGLTANLLWFSFFGRTFVFLKNMNPETIAYTCKRHGVTHFFAIPLMWNTLTQMVYKQAESEGKTKLLNKAISFSIGLQSIFPYVGKLFARRVLFASTRKQILGESVKFCISGGGRVKEDALRLMNALGYSLYNGYGMTEIGIASVELRLRAKKRLLNSIGKPFPSIRFRIGEDDSGDEGELYVKGGSLACKIIHNGETFIRDKDEWFKTGDLARRDKDGYYYIESRMDDIIIGESGENISPDVIESYYTLEHTGGICVYGEGERKYMIVSVPEAVSESQRERVFSKIYETNSSLPLQYKVTDVFVTEKPLPMVLESKVQRVLVIKDHRENPGDYARINLADYRDRSASDDERYALILSEVKMTIADILGKDVSEIGDDAHFILDLGGDSMSYFTLLDRLSAQYNVSFQVGGANVCTCASQFAAYILKN